MRWNKKYLWYENICSFNFNNFNYLFIYFNRKIFSICSQNKEEVNREALIQYLEAMIQLERRRNSTDTNKIKSIANDIIKFHKRQNNEVITKEEFISWYDFSRRISTLKNELFSLKANYEWCLTFLPPLTSEYMNLIETKTKRERQFAFDLYRIVIFTKLLSKS